MNNFHISIFTVMIGHGKRMCGKKKKDSQNSNMIEDQFGEWLRVSNERGFNKVKSWRKKEGMNLMASKAQILAKGCEARPVGAKIGFASREVVDGEKENKKNINTVREVVEEVTSGKESSLRVENGGNERVGRDTSSYIVISIVPKEKGGGLTEKRNRNIMEEGSKLGVFSELDQNIEGQRGMCRKKKEWIMDEESQDAINE